MPCTGMGDLPPDLTRPGRGLRYAAWELNGIGINGQINRETERRESAAGYWTVVPESPGSQIVD